MNDADGRLDGHDASRAPEPSGAHGVPPGELEIAADVADADHTLRLAGELDLATAPRLDAAIARACEAGARRVVLDLTDLTFLDSAGLRAMLQARSSCVEHGCSFLLTRPQPAVERLFALTGVAQALPLDADTSAR